MIDIVIDTCTLKHASNSKNKYFDQSVEFINKMEINDVKCTVDEGFAFDETLNKSYVGLEYIKHLQPGTPGYSLIVNLASNERIVFVTNVIPNNKKNRIEQLIVNKKDRMFLRVAYRSEEHTS